MQGGLISPLEAKLYYLKRRGGVYCSWRSVLHSSERGERQASGRIIEERMDEKEILLNQEAKTELVVNQTTTTKLQ